MYVLEGCEINVHKSCLEHVCEICAMSGSGLSGGGTQKKKQDKPRQTSVFGKMISRKPSTNSPSASKSCFHCIAV